MSTAIDCIRALCHHDTGTSIPMSISAADRSEVRAESVARATLHVAAVLRVTLLDLLRRPIVPTLMYSVAVLIAVMPFIPFLTLGQENRLVRDANLSLILMFGIALSVYAAGTGLCREIRRGGGELLLSKPISPLAFLAAKYAGVIVLLALFMLAATPAFIVSSRASRGLAQVDWRLEGPLLAGLVAAPLLAALIALCRRRNVSQYAALLLPAVTMAVLAVTTPYGHAHPPSGEFRSGYLLAAAAGVGLVLVNIAAIAMTLSTRLSIPVSASLTVLALVAGLSAGGIEIGGLSFLLNALVPDWMNFWILSSVPPASPHLASLFLWNLIQSFLFSSALFILGCLLFWNAEISKKST